VDLLLWISNPRLLGVARELSIFVWQPQEVCITLFVLMEPSNYYFGDRCKRESEIQSRLKDLKASVAYLNNVDVGQPLWRAEPRDK
jgi:hypothetical protein